MKSHIEIFATRRVNGFIALVWRNGLIWQVLPGRHKHATWIAALEWDATHRGEA